MNKKLVVFDWDGTLCDSVSAIVRCKTAVASSMDLPPPSESVVRNVLGMEFTCALKVCFPSASPTEIQQFAQRFLEKIDISPFSAALFPDIKALLHQLKDDGVLLAIATSKSPKALAKAFTHTNTEELFDFVCCGEDYKAWTSNVIFRSLNKVD